MASRKGRGMSRSLSVKGRLPPAPSSSSRINRNRPGGGSGSEQRSHHHHQHHRFHGMNLERRSDEGVFGRTKLKNCCRSVAAFMFTQVGVGGVIVGYAIVGAFVFTALETEGNPNGNDEYYRLEKTRNQFVDYLFTNWTEFQWSEEEWEIVANDTLKMFQDDVVYAVKKKGYDGKTIEEKWNFPAALMFTLSIFTMIGYGNLVPRTDWGKVVTILYACFGIPLYVLYFLNMGKALARAFKWVYIKLTSFSLRSLKSSNSSDSGSSEGEGVVMNSGGRGTIDSIVVPSTASIYVLLSYIALGSIMFANWEDWEYLDSVYFCVISLCKIGLGDFIPGGSLEVKSQEGNQVKLMINFVYLLLGLGLVAMCYNLLREEVLAKLKQMKADVKDICLVVRRECNCCNGQ